MTFRVGDEVVCVDAKGHPKLVNGSLHIAYVAKGGDTVPSVLQSDGQAWIDDAAPNYTVQLVELGHHETWSHWGYRAERFRPVAKRSDTLSIESFLTIKDGQFEGPKRVAEPVKKETV